MITIEKYHSNVGSYAPDFELPGIDRQVHHLGSYLEKLRGVAVVFMSNRCPYVKLYIPRLKQIQSLFEQQDFSLIGINASDTPEDSFDLMKSFALQHELNFPYIRDFNQDVATCFEAKKTPEIFLIDKKTRICYRGKIDDCPKSPYLVKNAYLRKSIAAFLAGKEIVPNYTEAVGSAIKWRKY